MEASHSHEQYTLDAAMPSTVRSREVTLRVLGDADFVGTSMDLGSGSFEVLGTLHTGPVASYREHLCETHSWNIALNLGLFMLSPLSMGGVALGFGTTAALTSTNALLTAGQAFMGSGFSGSRRYQAQQYVAGAFGFNDQVTHVTALHRVDTPVQVWSVHEEEDNDIGNLLRLATAATGAYTAGVELHQSLGRMQQRFEEANAEFQDAKQAQEKITKAQADLEHQAKQDPDLENPGVAEAIQDIAKVAQKMETKAKRHVARRAVAARPQLETLGEGLYETVSNRARTPRIPDGPVKTAAQENLDHLVDAVNTLETFEAQHGKEIEAVKAAIIVGHELMNTLLETVGVSREAINRVEAGKQLVAEGAGRVIKAVGRVAGRVAASYGETPQKQAAYGHAVAYATTVATSAATAIIAGKGAVKNMVRGAALNTISDAASVVTKTSRIQKVNGRFPINSAHAGSVYPLSNLPVEIRNKYPHSVPFTGTGHPDFSRYAIKKVQIRVTGARGIDERAANSAAGLKTTPLGYTWHHHHDGINMQLIPRDIHKAVSHTGGAAVISTGLSK